MFGIGNRYLPDVTYLLNIYSFSRLNLAHLAVTRSAHGEHTVPGLVVPLLVIVLDALP